MQAGNYLRVAIVLMAIYSSVAALMAIGAIANQSTWFFPLAAIVVIGLLGIVGLLQNTSWGWNCAVIFGFAVTCSAFVKSVPDAVACANALIGFAILLIAGAGYNDHWPRRVIDLNAHQKSNEQQMNQTPQDYERLKYELDRDRLAWEKTKSQAESSVLNRHAGVIITATVSIAAIVVSYLQLSISANNAKAQLDNETLRNDRQFYLETAKFLLDRQRQITTQDAATVAYLRDVVVSVFPPSVAVEIATRMRDTSRTNDVRKLWEEALLAIRNRPRK